MRVFIFLILLSKVLVWLLATIPAALLVSVPDPHPPAFVISIATSKETAVMTSKKLVLVVRKNDMLLI